MGNARTPPPQNTHTHTHTFARTWRPASRIPATASSRAPPTRSAAAPPACAAASAGWECSTFSLQAGVGKWVGPCVRAWAGGRARIAPPHHTLSQRHLKT